MSRDQWDLVMCQREWLHQHVQLFHHPPTSTATTSSLRRSLPVSPNDYNNLRPCHQGWRHHQCQWHYRWAHAMRTPSLTLPSVVDVHNVWPWRPATPYWHQCTNTNKYVCFFFSTQLYPMSLSLGSPDNDEDNRVHSTTVASLQAQWWVVVVQTPLLPFDHRIIDDHDKPPCEGHG